jgi:YbbR domain-containing protein
MTRWTRLTSAARRDPWTKLLAVAVACVVWYLTNIRERDAERVIDLPVVMRRVPRSLIVTQWPLDRVVVTLRGPGPLLDGIDERRSRVVVPLGGLESGTNVIDLKGARVEPELPSSLSLVRIQPGRATVVAAAVKKRSLPVRPVTIGKVAAGYRVARIEVDPERVEAAGPGKEVERLEDVGTAPIHVDGATAPVAARVFLEWAGDFVTFMPDRVAVRVEVEEISRTRQIDDVTIAVRGARRFRIEPPTVSLTLRAPASVLEAFALPADSVYVDVTGLGPGEHQVAVTVVLPPRIEVVTRRPEVHRIVIEEEEG